MTSMPTDPEIDNPDKPMTWSRCFAVPGSHTIVDLVHPLTGVTLHYGKTLADCQAEYPGAILMTVEEHCGAKAARQDTPVEWTEETEERHWEMLEVLPPACMIGGGFLVGEPGDHHALSGQPRFEAHIKRDGKYWVASRPMTRKEFKALYAGKSAAVAVEIEGA